MICGRVRIEAPEEFAQIAQIILGKMQEQQNETLLIISVNPVICGIKSFWFLDSIYTNFVTFLPGYFDVPVWQSLYTA